MLSEADHKYQIDIPNQFVELRPFYGGKGNSGIESLLEDVTDKQIEDAISLVNGKVIPKQIQTYDIDQHSKGFNFLFHCFPLLATRFQPSYIYSLQT